MNTKQKRVAAITKDNESNYASIDDSANSTSKPIEDSEFPVPTSVVQQTNIPLQNVINSTKINKNIDFIVEAHNVTHECAELIKMSLLTDDNQINQDQRTVSIDNTVCSESINSENVHQKKTHFIYNEKSAHEKPFGLLSFEEYIFTNQL